jgi:hypothetical protein
LCSFSIFAFGFRKANRQRFDLWDVHRMTWQERASFTSQSLTVTANPASIVEDNFGLTKAVVDKLPRKLVGFTSPA